MKVAFYNGNTLESSTTIWYATSNGMAFTNNASGVNENNIDAMAATWVTGVSVDGSMVMHDIRANRITGDLIAANTITSREIAVNTIVGENIVGGTITGSKIAAGQIYATNLARDAVFAFVWEYSGTSIGSGDQYANRWVRRTDGSYGWANFNDYDNLFVYAKDSTGNCSCICSRGTSGTLICDNQVNKDRTYLWFNTDYASFSSRSVVHKGNAVWFSDAHFLKFGRYETDGTLGSTLFFNLHTHGVDVGPSWSTDNSLCVPYKIYGVIVGT